MNIKRRRKILQVICALEEQLEQIESVCEEEQEAYDNLPEGIQGSDRGDTMYEIIDGMESAYSDLKDIISNLQEIVER